MASCTQVVGYTADADVYCPECAAEIYPAKCSSCGQAGRLFDPGWHRDCEGTGDPGYFQAFDGEGNEVSAIFGDSYWDSPVHCSVCGELLEVELTSDGEDYVKRALADGDGDPEVLATWAAEYSYLVEDCG